MLAYLLRSKVLPALVLISATLLLLPASPLAEAASPTLKVTSSGVVPQGSSVTINVKISHFAPKCCSFDTFDVSVVTNPEVLLPQSITAGTKVASWTVFIDCVNGVGTGCVISDTAGIAHLAMTSSSGTPVFSHGPSILFSITYTAVNSFPSTDINATSVTVLHAGVAITPVIIDGFYG